MKTRFNSDDDLPLNKPLKFHAVTIIMRSVFEEGSKLYPHCVSIMKMLHYEKIEVSEGIDTNKTSASKNVCFVIIVILKMLSLDLNHMFAINVMMF